MNGFALLHPRKVAFQTVAINKIISNIEYTVTYSEHLNAGIAPKRTSAPSTQCLPETRPPSSRRINSTRPPRSVRSSHSPACQSFSHRVCGLSSAQAGLAASVPPHYIHLTYVFFSCAPALGPSFANSLRTTCCLPGDFQQETTQKNGCTRCTCCRLFRARGVHWNPDAHTKYRRGSGPTYTQQTFPIFPTFVVTGLPDAAATRYGFSLLFLKF